MGGWIVLVADSTDGKIVSSLLGRALPEKFSYKNEPETKINDILDM